MIAKWADSDRGTLRGLVGVSDFGINFWKISGMTKCVNAMLYYEPESFQKILWRDRTTSMRTGNEEERMDRNHHGNGWAVFKGNGESGKKRETFKQEVYDLMCGQMEPDESVVPGAGDIRNEFAEGSFCGKEYEKIYEANRNLCEWLGVDEDRDVEMIMDSFCRIMWHLSI